MIRYRFAGYGSRRATLLKLYIIPLLTPCIHFMYPKIHPRIALYTQELVWTLGFVGVWVGGCTVRLLF
jgi:hypothetical protein